MLNPGARLGPHEIVASLGAGGMGEVYRARDTRLGREVAIKVLPAVFAADPDRLRRFELEARATAAISRPNILSVFDVGSHDGSPFLVEELLEGETLRARLAAAHARGIVHCDFKPENLSLTRDVVVKILDFGLATLARGEGETDLSAASTATSPSRPPPAPNPCRPTPRRRTHRSALHGPRTGVGWFSSALRRRPLSPSPLPAGG